MEYMGVVSRRRVWVQSMNEAGVGSGSGWNLYMCG